MARKFLIAWAERYGITPAQARKLRLLSNRLAFYGVCVCNGDAYPGISPDDKAACSNAWNADLAAKRREFEKLAADMGFDGVKFGLGLFPVLAKGQETVIDIP